VRLREEFWDWFESKYHLRVKENREKSIEWRDGKYHGATSGKLQYQQHVMRLKIDGGAHWTAGQDALKRMMESSWWGWDDGSRCFHWRWPKWYRECIRDGLEVHFPGSKPNFKRAQKDIRGEDAKAKVIEKLRKMAERRYIVPGKVESLTSVFTVEKADDIRLVYNAAESGLNNAMVVP
jgi:hypothetical protein